MLVLITYDVNTQTAAGEENACVKLRKSVPIMDREYRIQYLSARWMQQNAGR